MYELPTYGKRNRWLVRTKTKRKEDAELELQALEDKERDDLIRIVKHDCTAFASIMKVIVSGGKSLEKYGREVDKLNQKNADVYIQKLKNLVDVQKETFQSYESGFKLLLQTVARLKQIPLAKDEVTKKQQQIAIEKGTFCIESAKNFDYLNGMLIIGSVENAVKDTICVRARCKILYYIGSFFVRSIFHKQRAAVRLLSAAAKRSYLVYQYRAVLVKEEGRVKIVAERWKSISIGFFLFKEKPKLSKNQKRKAKKKERLEQERLEREKENEILDSECVICSEPASVFAVTCGCLLLCNGICKDLWENKFRERGYQDGKVECLKCLTTTSLAVV